MADDDISVGSVSVDVVPSTRNFSKRLSALIDAALKPVTEQITNAIAKAISDGFAVGSKSATVEGLKSGKAFGDAVRDSLDSALADLPDAKVDGDLTEFDEKLAEARASLHALSLNIGVGIDLNDADVAELAGVKAELEDLAAESPDVTVRANVDSAVAHLAGLQSLLERVAAESPTVEVDVDATRAEEELAAVAAEADEVGRKSPTVKVNADTSEASASISTLLTLVASIGPALIPIGAAAVGGLGGIAATAAAGAAGLGVLGLGLSQVSKATGLLTKQQALSAQAAQGSSRAQIAAAAAIANAERAVKSAKEALAQTEANVKNQEISAAEQVQSAEQSLADARRNAAEQVISSAEQVASAEQNLADAQRSAADGQISAEEQVASAEQSSTNATQQAADAVQALNDAREQAARDLESYTNSVVDANLSVQQSQLDVTAAEEQYQKDLADPTVTPEQREQDELNVAKAKQQLVEAQQRLTNSTADNNKAQAEGVNGAPGVIAAQRQVAASILAQQQATQALRDAQRHQTEQAITGAQQVANAEQSVADALRHQQDSATSAAEAIVRAERAVADAERARNVQGTQGAFQLEQAHERLAAALRRVATANAESAAAGSAALNKINAQLALLNPATVKFAQFIEGTLKPAFRSLQSVAAQGLLPGLQAALVNLEPLFKPLTGFVSSLAKLIGDLAVKASKALTDPFWTQFFTYVATVAGPILSTFAHIIGDLATGFAGLVEAFQPVTDQIGAGLLHLTDAFAKFGTGHGDGLTSFISYLLREGPVVAATLGRIFQAVGHLVVALAPLGDVVLKSLGALATVVSHIPPSVILAIASAVAAVAVSAKVLSVAMAALDFVLDADPIVLVGLAIAALGAAFIVAYRESKAFRDFIQTDIMPVLQGIWSFITDKLVPVLQGILSDALAGVRGAFNDIAGAIQSNRPELEQLLHAFEDVVGFIVEKVLPILGPILKKYIEGLAVPIGVAIDILGLLVDAFNGVVDVIKGVVGAMSEVVKFFESAWSHITGLSSGAIDAIVGFVAALPGRLKDTVVGAFNSIYNEFAKVINKIIDVIDSLHFTLPSIHIPGLGTFGGETLRFINVPDLPYLALGGTIAKAGNVIVGDNGPEVLSLGVGATVTPLPRFQQANSSISSADLESILSANRTFTGDLYLDSGEFLGKVRGEANSVLDGRIAGAKHVSGSATGGALGALSTPHAVAGSR